MNTGKVEAIQTCRGQTHTELQLVLLHFEKGMIEKFLPLDKLIVLLERRPTNTGWSQSAGQNVREEIKRLQCVPL